MATDMVQWVLTDTVQSNIWLDHWSVTSQQLPSHHTVTPWKIEKRTLTGGKRHGIDLIHLDNGALQLDILPTRGMSIWRGQFRDIRLGWDAPLHGPVHPQWVNLDSRGGLGWLDGFDEWICRCGIAFNGPPGDDLGRHITLHGKIANTPAHFVGVRVAQTPPYTIEIVGRVQESSLFGDNLHLTTVISTTPGSNQFSIHDLVENRSSKETEMQMLYHCNFGKPLLEKGSQVKVPAIQVAPRDANAATHMRTYESYDAPTTGMSECVNYYQPIPDENGDTLAVLHTAEKDKACAIRFCTKALPWFIVWKNTADERDGYVTGLEPATGFPNFRSIEREHHRIVKLPAGATWNAKLTVQVENQYHEIKELLSEVTRLQGKHAPTVLSQPNAIWSGITGKSK